MRSTGRLGFAWLLIHSVLFGCSGAGPDAPSGGKGGALEGTGYRLVILDSEKEVRRRYTGEAEVPWAKGTKASRFESTLLTIKEGFVLPDEFRERWRDALTTFLVEYGQTDGSACSDFGWVLTTP